jgi:uroporphyrinogen decarboxylase
MTPRELVIRTLNHQAVERVPRDLLDGTGRGRARADDLAEIQLRFRPDILHIESKCLPGRLPQARSSRPATVTDAWGCTWQGGPSGGSVAGTGVELVDAPLADAAQIAGFEPPAELLDKAPVTKANRASETTSRFVLAESQARPFSRLTWLRGRQAALSDLARGTKRIRTLLARLHDSFCRELELWAGSDVDGVLLGDDFAGEDGLLIDPQIWRDLFRPLYRDYCKILHEQDKFVFFHSAGKLNQVFGTLIRLGVDAIHSPLLAASVERFANRYRGQVTFWIEIDPQHARPESTPEEVREAVLRVRKALDYGSGGVIAAGRWTADVPLRNTAALYEQWLVPLPMHVS